MNCTGCRHLDKRQGECLQLNHMAVCGPCLKVYPINEIRCSCGETSFTHAGQLRLADGGYQASPYCPLSKAERDALTTKQNTPVVRQKELF